MTVASETYLITAIETESQTVFPYTFRVCFGGIWW
jgi:hypothetical protein